jgi:hypothetical protein
MARKEQVQIYDISSHHFFSFEHVQIFFSSHGLIVSSDRLQQ